MKLDIKIDKKYFKSDSIEHGRIVAKFFEKLSRNVFSQSYRYWDEMKNLTGTFELPILHDERNLYSTFASAIHKITPLHLSEWTFNKSSKENGRRVDFWCLDKNGEAGKPINYFIEIKKSYYCLNKKSKKGFTKKVEADIKSAMLQASSLKRLSPKWENIDDVYLGLVVVHAYYNGEEEHYDYSNIRENINALVDKRLNAQLIISTWVLPDDFEVQWEDGKCRFISVAGIVITKKRKHP